LFGAPSALATTEVNGGDNEPVAYANQELFYVCFDESLSDVARVITAISTLDTDPHSPVSDLKRYIQDGYMLGLRDEVLSVLDYAEWFVDHYDDKDIQRLLAPQLEKVIEQVLRGELDVSEQDVMRSSDLRLTINSKARFRQDVRMDKKLYVHGKAHFDDDVTFRDDVKIKDNLTVVGNLLVEGAFSVTDGSLADITIGNLSVTNHTVSGTLSAADAAIGCDVSVGCNVKLKKSTSSSQGNITKESDSFIHDFGVNNFFAGVKAGNFTMTGSACVGVGIEALGKNTQEMVM
jgi:hypothetical protein